MALFRPNARLTVDGQALSADEAGLAWLRVQLSVDGTHDRAMLGLWPASRLADAAPGARIDIELGPRDGEEAVFGGQLSARTRQPGALVLEALAATVALSRSNRSQAFRNQSVADIVRDLAGSASVDEVQGTLKLPAYHVDNRRPVWRHLQDLARLVGADLGSAADGGLRFVPAAGPGQVLQLQHGADLLDWRLAQGEAAEPAEVAAVGAASESGDARWHWLRHDPVGAGAAATRLPAALATRDGAQAVADSLAARARRAKVSGELLLQGRPALRPGQVVELVDLPGGSPGKLRVRAVEHTLDGHTGFLTRLQVEGAS